MKRIAVGLAVMVCLSATGALAVDVDVNVFVGLKELGYRLKTANRLNTISGRSPRPRS